MAAVSPMRVLVVDDCDDAALTMAFLLKRHGHETVMALNGEAALREAPHFHPDAVFIDLSMPGIDGFSLARQLRQMPEFVETPLVAVIGHVDAEHRTQATAAGFTEFMPKPYPLAVLEATMERVSAKINAALTMATNARIVAEQTRRLNEQARSALDSYWRTRQVGPIIPVTVTKSGISNIVTLPVRSAADELRAWVKQRRCRVGPVFEVQGQFAFCVYSKRHRISELIAKNGAFAVT